MKNRAWGVLGVLGVLGACGSTQIYPRYVIVPSQNLLRGHEPKDDLDLYQTCEPDAPVPHPTPGQPAPRLAKCIAMKEEVFYKAEQELLELRQALKDCQAGPPPSNRAPTEIGTE